MFRLAIIIGSTRPGRNGEAVAKWIYEIARQRKDTEVELVDIRDYNLPLLDEPSPLPQNNIHRHIPESGPRKSFLSTVSSLLRRNTIMRLRPH